MDAILPVRNCVVSQHTYSRTLCAFRTLTDAQGASRADELHAVTMVRINVQCFEAEH